MSIRRSGAKYLAGVFLALAGAGAVTAAEYDLSATDGINCFGGSEQAAKLLAAQGFVVAAPDYRQIFEPYLRSDLPVFITPDTAWHTYHMLLEEGVKEMERGQSARLAEFSRRLVNAARQRATNGLAEFSTIADYASVGLAFQDRAHRGSLEPRQKQMLADLLSNTVPVVMPIGFPLSPVQFRPQSFYTESPDLSDYYSARQWYACVDFRLSNENETQLALCLSWLIEADTNLLGLWTKLSEPYDALVAPPEDGTVTTYTRSAKAVLGAGFGPASFKSRLGEIRKRLGADVGTARINDQNLSPEEYLVFPRLTKGFRLLPPRQLPCGVCFQNTVDPKIAGRMLPSGLDFMAASPALRSTAAVRALEAEFGKNVAEAVQKADCPPMPDSLHGRAMELLAKLQQPLPESVPRPLRTEAWADLQLWTQLAAWSEQRHTWALYSKFGGGTAGGLTPPPGIVAPYPEFFAGLAKLARDSASALARTDDQEFDAKALAAELYEMERLVRNNYDGMDRNQLAAIRPRTAHFSRFMGEFYKLRSSEMQANPRKFNDNMLEQLKRVATTGLANPEEIDTIRLYYNTRQFAAPALSGLAEICDRLAELAIKQLHGETPTHEDADWAREYGRTIAGLQGYFADSWPDEFPIIARIFDDQTGHSILYAGVARPQTLYVILPYKGKPQLYRGAVLSYREFARPEDQPLDDNLWRETVQKSKAPPPPEFTRSFLRTDEATKDWKASLMAPPLVPAPPPPPIRLAVKEVDLGPFPSDRDERLLPSPDDRHIAYRTRTTNGSRIDCDGVSGREYEEARYPSFSPDGRHRAYLARTGKKWCVVLDGAEGPMFWSIGDQFVFSPDSARLAYVADIEQGKSVVVIDGVQGPVFDDVLAHSFSFSENSKHFAYGGRRGAEIIVIKDNEEKVRGDYFADRAQSYGLGIERMLGPILSPDGQRLACGLWRGTNIFLLLDGVASRPWDELPRANIMGQPEAQFSPDGRHFSYVGILGKHRSVVVDQSEDTNGWMNCAVFSPDGRHWAYARISEGPDEPMTSCAVLDGVAGKTYKGEIEGLTFSPDGGKLAYNVREGANEYVVVHGCEEYDDYADGSDIEFSPDSRHMAFLGLKNGRSFVVVDGQGHYRGEMWEGGERITFSPDSQRWGYTARHNQKSYAVISGVEYGPYDTLGPPVGDLGVCFSPDSRHFAFMATKDLSPTNNIGRQSLVVDGLEHELDGEWYWEMNLLRFDSPTNLHALVAAGGHIFRLEAAISEK